MKAFRCSIWADRATLKCDLSLNQQQPGATAADAESYKPGEAGVHLHAADTTTPPLSQQSTPPPPHTPPSHCFSKHLCIPTHAQQSKLPHQHRQTALLLLLQYVHSAVQVIIIISCCPARKGACCWCCRCAACCWGSGCCAAHTTLGEPAENTRQQQMHTKNASAGAYEGNHIAQSWYPPTIMCLAEQRNGPPPPKTNHAHA